MNRMLIDLWVGIFVVMGIAATVFIALRVSNLSSGTSNDLYYVSAAFDNIGDLKVRAPVKSAGVIVGRVTGIRFDDEHAEAVVTVGLDQRFHFSTDSSMSILTTGLLGEQYIGLTTGGEEEMLKDGDTVWLTSSAVVLETLISKFLFNTSSNPEK